MCVYYANERTGGGALVNCRMKAGPQRDSPLVKALQLWASSTSGKKMGFGDGVPFQVPGFSKPYLH